MFDQDNSKLKRLGLFFSEDKLEQAKNIIENFKQKRTEFELGDKSSKKKEQDDSSSSSHSSEMLENLTENSRYSTLNEFQTVMREKVVDIKVSLHMIVSLISFYSHFWMKLLHA